LWIGLGVSTERRVAQRYAAQRKHYRFDQRKLKGLNHPGGREDSMREDGGYSVYKIKVVPIKDVKVPKVWKPGRLPKLLERMRKDQPIDPIRADKTGSKWEISDGIHRTNASIEMGYTHIPILYSEWVETPEAFVPEPPEKPQLRLGEWVKLKEPVAGREYGWVVEKLGPRKFRQVKRHWYNVALVKPGDEKQRWTEDIDLADTDFEPVRPPPWGPPLFEQFGYGT